MKIPIITAQTNIPSSIPGTASAGMEYEALGNFGGELQRLAVKISSEQAEVRKKFDEANNLLTLNSKVNDVLNYTQQLDKQLDEDPNVNPLDRQAVYLDRVNKKKAELLSDIPDELLRKRAELELSKNIMVAGLQQGAKGRKKEDERVEATTEAQMLEFANKGKFDKVKELADFLVNKGLRNQSWANEKVDKYTEIGQKALIHTKFESENIDDLKSLKKEIDGASKLSLLEKSIFKGEVQNKITRLEEKNKREEKEAAATNIFNDLKTTFGNDYGLALDALSNPEYSEILQKKYKGDLDAISKVRASLHNEKAIEDAKIIKTHEKTAADNFVNMDDLASDQTRGLSTIRAQVANNQLDWKVGEHFKNAIINPPEQKSDPAEYLSVLNDLAMDKDKGEISGRILASKKLSLSDKKALGQELYREQSAENKEWTRQAREHLKGMINPQFGLLEKVARTTKESERVVEAIKALDQKVEDAKRSGKPIQGREILATAQELVPAYRIPLAEAIADRARSLEKTGEEIKTKMDREKVIKDKAKKYKTDKEVTADYEANKITYEDASAILKYKFGAQSGNR